LTTHYEIIIDWLEDGNAFVAEVPETPACLAYGDCHENARASVKPAIRPWIDAAREFGRDLSKPEGCRLMLA